MPEFQSRAIGVNPSKGAVFFLKRRVVPGSLGPTNSTQSISSDDQPDQPDAATAVEVYSPRLTLGKAPKDAPSAEPNFNPMAKPAPVQRTLDVNTDHITNFYYS